jgi:triacylglycerol lipase
MSFLNEWPLDRYKQNSDAFTGFKAKEDFDLVNARALMWAAQLVYELDLRTSQESVDKVKQVLGFWRMQFVQTVSIPGLSIQGLPQLASVARDALVISKPDAIIVAFAGTDPPRLQDWLVNFAARPSATGVSMGLAEAASLFVPLLAPIIDANRDKKLFVTGHSLGGALGVAVAHELSKSKRSAEAVYTFGMPRAGDATFAADYDQRLGQRTFRFVHGEDLVPSVPPAQLLAPALAPHQHVGFFIHCDRGKKFMPDQKSLDTKSNQPIRDDDIVMGALGPTGLVVRALAVWGALAAGGPPLQIALELLPPRIRQHLQDQYIAALTP